MGSLSPALSFLVWISPYLLSLVALLTFLEQLSYLKKKRFLPGPSLILPFLGNSVSVVRNPTKFWDDQSTYAKSSSLGLSANYIFGRFIVYIHRSDLSHKVFTNVRPDAFQLTGYPFGKKLFGENNLIYMLGQDHKDHRSRIAPNFTTKALSTYISLQCQIIRSHLLSWEQLSANSKHEPIKLRFLIRDMNLESSQTVFVGPYLTQQAREKFKEDFNLFTVGLMKPPIDFPGSGFHKARLALDRVVKTLADCATLSKSHMLAGHEPTCLVDFWMQQLLLETAGNDSNQEPPLHTTDIRIGGYLFDFLLAAQDASVSSIIWAITLLDSHREILSKVRAEVSNVLFSYSITAAQITADHIRELKYTEAVAREVLRYRSPAAFVPHIALHDFDLTESFTIPKGTIVFPSVLDSSFQGFTDPHKFDPDRFLNGREEGTVYRRNFLAFGAGPHQCVGQKYAMNHLVLFIAMFTSMLDFQRPKSDGCDDIVYVPTTCPKDHCRVFLKLRV